MERTKRIQAVTESVNEMHERFIRGKNKLDLGDILGKEYEDALLSDFQTLCSLFLKGVALGSFVSSDKANAEGDKALEEFIKMTVYEEVLSSLMLLSDNEPSGSLYEHLMKHDAVRNDMSEYADSKMAESDLATVLRESKERKEGSK